MWPLRRLKTIADVTVSTVDKLTVEGQVPVRLCNYTDVYAGGDIRDDRPFMTATATPEQVRRFRLRVGQTLITKDSETADDIGAPAYVAESAPALVCGYHLAMLTPRSSEAHPRYLYWAVRSEYCREQLSAAALGVTRFGLRIDAIEGLTIPLPPLDEQQRIVTQLDAENAKIDGVTARRCHMLDRLDERTQAVRAEWWQHWAETSGTVPLRRVGARVEQGWSPRCDAVSADPHEWGVLKTSAVSGNTFNPIENKRLPDGVAVERRWQVRDGDLLVVRGSGSVRSVGAVAVAEAGPRLLTISDLLYRIRGLMGPPKFFAEAMRAPQVRQIIEGTIRTDAGQTLKLRSDDVTHLPVPAVPAERRSEALDDLRERFGRTTQLRDALSRQVLLIAEHRRSLIASAIVGEKEAV
jgi:type I restriction enzyme S subunit